MIKLSIVIHYLEAGELSKDAIFGGKCVVGNDIEQQLRKLAGRIFERS